MDSIREKFCQSLRKWFEEEFVGDRSQLAEDLGVSYEQICNILNGRRCGDESWRRKTASYVGIPYETMIGIDQTAENGGNESETAAPSRSSELLPGWLRHLVPQLRYLNRTQRDKLVAWLELEGLDPPSRGRMSPAGPLGGDRSGRVKTKRQTTEPARVHSLDAFRHQFPRLPNTSAPVMVHDGQVFLAVNAAMCELIGASEREIIGTKVIDWLPPREQKCFLTRVSRSDTSPCRSNIISREKGAVPMEITMVRITNWRGRQVRVVSLRRAEGDARQRDSLAGIAG